MSAIVILGGEDRGNNSFQTMLVRKQKSMAIVKNSLHPLSIILLPNVPPHCHWWPKNHIRLTLDIRQSGPVILGGEGRGNNSIQTMLVCKQNQWQLWKILSIHWPSYCCLIQPPNCHWRPENHIRLTLDIGKGGLVIWG